MPDFSINDRPASAVGATSWVETDDGTVIPGGVAATEYLVAAIDRRQAALAASTPEQAAARERYYRELDKHYRRLSAAKRKQGHGDCSRELAAAERLASMTTRLAAVDIASARTAPRARGAGRPPRPGDP
jgi:hypothetical protein